MKQEYAIFFQNRKLIIGRHGNSNGLHRESVLMITLTLLDASRTHLIFDIIVYTDADTDACCNAAIEISADYFFFQESMRTLTIAHWVGLNP